MPLVFTMRSAVTIQFSAANRHRRQLAAQAFQALGGFEDTMPLHHFGADVVKFLCYDDAPVAWQRILPWFAPRPLAQRTYCGLEELHLTVVEYHQLGVPNAPHCRGVRVVARPVNGPVVRAFGSADGELNFAFYRLDPEGWYRFFQGIELNPDDPYHNCPPGIVLLEQVDAEWDFVNPMNFT